MITKKKTRVFVADDSLIVCNRLISLLSEVEGVEIVGKAHNVNSAIQCIAALVPDLIVLDIHMPGGSGIDILKYVKQEIPDSIVVMLTNYPYDQYRNKCMQEGADCFLDKSTEFEQITEIIERLAAKS